MYMYVHIVMAQTHKLFLYHSNHWHIEMEVKVISRETITPSSPTPQHLRSYKLSLLDQIAPHSSHGTIILFYSHDDSHPSAAQRLHTLKKSLSETLTRFYPLAGRRKGNTHVDCNDEGIDFFEARVVDAQLSQVLQHPDPNLLSHLLPCGSSCGGSMINGPLMCIQVNIYDCQGMAIGVCVSHRIGDGIMAGTFLTAWAAAARGEGALRPGPSFDAVSLFPPSDKMEPLVVPQTRPMEKLVTKRFVFEASKMAILKSSISNPPPTRVEAVVALIWGCGMRARGNSRVSVMTMLLNIRGRMMPPLPEYSFGNLITYAAASEMEAGDDKGHLVELLKNAIRNIDAEKIKKLQGVDGPSFAFEAVKEAARKFNKSSDADVDDIDFYHFTSWFNSSWNEADFGWGEPIWVGPARCFVRNLVILTGPGKDQEMEAWVTLEENEMAEFEKDQEIVFFARA